MQGRVEYQGDFSNLPKNDKLFEYLNLIDSGKSTKRKQSIKDSRISVHSNTSDMIEDDEISEPEETERLINSGNSNETREEKKPMEENIHTMTKGKVMVWKYFAAGDSCFLPFAAFMAFTAAQFFCSSCDYFVAFW